MSVILFVPCLHLRVPQIFLQLLRALSFFHLSFFCIFCRPAASNCGGDGCGVGPCSLVVCPEQTHNPLQRQPQFNMQTWFASRCLFSKPSFLLSQPKYTANRSWNRSPLIDSSSSGPRWPAPPVPCQTFSRFSFTDLLCSFFSNFDQHTWTSTSTSETAHAIRTHTHTANTFLGHVFSLLLSFFSIFLCLPLGMRDHERSSLVMVVVCCAAVSGGGKLCSWISTRHQQQQLYWADTSARTVWWWTGKWENGRWQIEID